MKISQLVDLLKQFRPATEEEFGEDIPNVNLIPLGVGRGCFRDVFGLGKMKAVIKFPHDNLGIKHARNEMKAVRNIQQKRKSTMRHLWRYVPRVYFFDDETGVIVMELLHSTGKITLDHGGNIIAQMFEDTFHPRGHDACGDNLGKNSRGQIKLLDLGCV